MRENGRLYVFEGPDGVGKTTLSSAFTKMLNDQGVIAELFSFPGRDPGTIGQLVNQVHHTPDRVGVRRPSPSSLQALHIAAHLDSIDHYITPALEAGRTVVLDRYWWSTWVYGTADRSNPKTLDLLIQAEKSHWAKFRPAMIFAIARQQPLNEQCSPERWNTLVKLYHKIAERESQGSRVCRIWNEGTVAESLDQIRKAARLNPGLRRRSNAPEGIEQLRFGFPDQKPPGLTILSRLAPAKPTVVFDTYWRFAAERQEVFYRRQAGQLPPWTTDPILQEYKFTNAYRASDRVSQYLIRHVIYDGDQSPQELFFRILLFKVFNKIETWELLRGHLGEVCYSEYSFKVYDTILNDAISNGERIYSAAYIMPSGGKSAVSGGRKHSMHLRLIERMMKDELPLRIAAAPTMGKAFEMLRSYPTIGDFLAYQYVTDLNYSTLTGFPENEFVVPGPGARDGIRKCFYDLGGLNEPEIIKLVAEKQNAEFERLGIRFKSLWGRSLQLIDCQNLFCEVDKYARVKHPEIAGVSGRTRIKQRHRANRDALQYFYPPKWGINDKIPARMSHVSSI